MFSGAEDTPTTARDWFKRGGKRSLFRIQEIGDVDNLKKFARFLDRRGESYLKKGAMIPLRVWRGYWQGMGIATDFREAILRYANYLDYNDQMANDPDGKPRNFGGSVPDEVMGIRDRKDRAFKLSNDLMGPYDDVSIAGQELRTDIYPFWSFQETNLRTYLQGMRNIANDERIAGKAGRYLLAKAVGRKLAFKVFIKAPLRVVQLGRWALLLYGGHAALQVLNWLFNWENDKELPPNVRNRAHITLGRNKDGKVRHFSRLGTSADFLEWFGADQPTKDFEDYFNGRRTAWEIVKDAGFNPVNKMAQGISPFIRQPFELLTGYSLFPDVRTPIRIRDRWEAFFRTWGLEEDYKTLTDKPDKSKPGERIQKLFIYLIEPGRAAYSTIQGRKFKYRKKIGKPRGFSEGGRADALYNYRLSLRARDEDSAQRYLMEYEAMGGTPGGIKQSLKNMHPLGGLTRQESRDFVGTLSVEDREELEKAIQYYHDVLLGE